MKLRRIRNIGQSLRTVFWLGLQLLCLAGIGQVTSFNFKHLTNAEGLSDGDIHAFVQDKYGFMWIGTSYGLNRFDGISVRTWFHDPKDSGSLANNLVQSLFCDSKSNLWIGSLQGVGRYDYSTNRFVQYPSAVPLVIFCMQEDKKGTIWLGTDNGLWTVNEKKKAIEKFTMNDEPGFRNAFQCSVRQIIDHRGEWYMASNRGVKQFNPLTYAFSEMVHDSLNKNSLSGDAIASLSLDSSGHLWAACVAPQSILNRIDLATHAVTLYDHFITAQKKWGTNRLEKVMTDAKGRVWVTTAYSGLSLYDPVKDNFNDYQNDSRFPNSVIANQNINIYQGRDGIIWLGTQGYGVSYFNPEKNFFHVIYPSFDENDFTTDTWCRSACEDTQGNLWLGTGKGLGCFTPDGQMIRKFVNEENKVPVIQRNSIRALLRDRQGDIWIGTAGGLNRFHPGTGKMDFFGKEEGMPPAFFWMLAEDKKGDIWMATTGGLFHYDRSRNRFADLAADSALSRYAHRNIQAIYIDRNNNLWVGVLDAGLCRYNIDDKTMQLLTIKDSLISDTRFSSMAEDKEGVLWIGSENGLVAYDPGSRHSRFFTYDNGLPSNRTNNIMVDSLDRIWIGSSNGLCMLNKERTGFKRFDVNDGLLTNHFNEQSASRTRDGLFIYPSYRGFVIFRPEQYREDSSHVSFYITSFKVVNREITANSQDLAEINLRPSENSFSMELAALDYMNPYGNLYAYRLAPFDKDWIYVDRRGVNYTNVPAGDYLFQYKVMDGKEQEKTIRITIRQVFYKTWWFRAIAILLLAGLLIMLSRYRGRHRERILALQGQAQSLEKEKTLVMYENLKQHLNPHFLFNSLASLSSLIRLDQTMASNFLDKMSRVYRYILKNRDNSTVPLAEELKFVNLYIQLQKTRFEEGLRVNIDIDDEHLQQKIAPVTLQNLVENAIKHNIADPGSPLVIELFVDDDYLIVRNNLQKKKFVETSNKQGLINMTSLYNYLSPLPLQIIEDEQYFTVKIPLL
jgi:ligand-binding sensor domain-containing protein